MIEREKKRIKLNKKYKMKRNVLLNSYKNEKNFNLKLELHGKLQKLPQNSAKTRLRNRCWKTGRPRGVFQDFGISRHVFRRNGPSMFVTGCNKIKLVKKKIIRI